MSVLERESNELGSSGDVALRYFGAVLAFISQAIHLWILPEAFVVTLLPGLFFLFVGIFQGVLAVRLLFRPGRWTLRLGISFNLLLTAIWVVTRFVSLPALTGSAQTKVGLLGAMAMVAQIALMVSIILLMRNDR
ncbi:hypothetical protein [Haloarchaeobius amylolyticus]|uniref:hypothetical protein n=1 Tax=Haloarchaeobius amylolyticus TaxID=1198296 RepID=UPI0022702FD9|nr:hypothetical protein [Haloarchaeobius amylolyticus]